MRGCGGIVGSPCGPIVGLEAPELPNEALGAPKDSKSLLANGALRDPKGTKISPEPMRGLPPFVGSLGPFWGPFLLGPQKSSKDHPSIGGEG